MNYKKSFVIVSFLIFAISCRQVKPGDTEIDKSIEGLWGMCGIVYYQNGNITGSTNFNECPKIQFNKNHSGFIRRNDPRLLLFSWKFIGDALLINHTTVKDKDEIIPDGIYKITPIDRKTYKELDLVNVGTETKYILGK